MTLRLLNAYAKFLEANNMYYQNQVEFDRPGERSPQQQQSYSGLRLPDQTQPTFEMTPGFTMCVIADV